MTEKNETKTQKRDIKPGFTSPQQPHQTDDPYKAWEKMSNSGGDIQGNQNFDSTSMVELTVMKESFDPLITNEVKILDEIDEILESIEDSPESDSENLDDQINVLKKVYINVTNAEKAITASLTAQHVKIGKLSLKIKKIVLSQDFNWEKWAKSNLKFMNKRTRQTYMQLAQIPNVEKYLMFGKERLLLIWREIKDIAKKDDPDPIGTFLKKHGVDFETAMEKPLVEFKNIVDTAVIIEKTAKKDLDLDRESVRGLIEIGFKFTNADFQQFVDIKEADGDPNKLLDKLFINKGRREDVYEQPDKKKASFIRTTAQMKRLVDDMIKNKKFEDIEPKEISDLIKKLKDFRKKLINH